MPVTLLFLVYNKDSVVITGSLSSVHPNYSAVNKFS